MAKPTLGQGPQKLVKTTVKPVNSNWSDTPTLGRAVQPKVTRNGVTIGPKHW